MPQWTVLSRAGCTLCEQMLEELAAALPAADAARVEIIDIADHPDLEAKYGRRIPVLLADGDFVCAYRLDGERLRGYLQD